MTERGKVLGKVLIVDDDKDIVGLVAGLLRAAGHAVVPAYDAMQGLMLAQREQPALILVDIQMPAGGGLQLLERLAGNFRTSGIPVIAMSASPQPTLADETRSRGAAAFLPKPIDRSALIETVRRVLAGSADPDGSGVAGAPA